MDEFDIIQAEAFVARHAGSEYGNILKKALNKIHEQEKQLKEAGCRTAVSVVQPWVSNLTLRMQATLLLGTRGPDMLRAPGIKQLIRWLRSLVYVPGNPENVTEFMLVEPPNRIEDKSEIHRELEFISVHFYTHLMHALEEVAYGYPRTTHAGQDIANRAFQLYCDMCELLHVPCESSAAHAIRLEHLEWPGKHQPLTGEEAFHIIAEYKAFSRRDLEVLKLKENLDV